MAKNRVTLTREAARRARALGRDPRRWARGMRYALGAVTGTRDFERFVIVSRSRSGSNLLVSLLDDHPQIRAEGELLGRLDGRRPEDVLRRLYRRHPPGIRAVGFKYFYYHPVDGEPAAVWRLLDPTEYRIVHLRRENPLRAIVSRQIASTSQAWSRRRGQELPIERRRVQMSPSELKNHLERTRTWEAEARARWGRGRYVEVTYEALASDPASISRSIQEFLGVDPHPTRTPLRRQNPERTSELLENYEELREAFASTEWASLFDG